MRQPDYFNPNSEEQREAPSNESDDGEYYVYTPIEEEDTSVVAIRHFDDLPLNTTTIGLRYRIVKWGLISVLVLIPLILLPILFLYVRNSEKTRPCDDMMWSFNKTAIRDLPSSDVQSIHIENGSGPVEVGDDAFEWHELKSKKTSEQSAPPVTTEQPEQHNPLVLSKRDFANEFESDLEQVTPRRSLESQERRTTPQQEQTAKDASQSKDALDQSPREQPTVYMDTNLEWSH